MSARRLEDRPRSEKIGGHHARFFLIGSAFSARPFRLGLFGIVLALSVSLGLASASFAQVSASTSSPLITIPSPPQPGLSSVTTNATSIAGGSTCKGTVLYLGVPPTNPAVVTLSSSNPAVVVPPSVSVTFGQSAAAATTDASSVTPNLALPSSSASFTITTTAVTVLKTATITAAYNGISKTATLTVYPPPPFQITGINNGDTLSGDVVVNVALPNGNLNGGSLSLAVDGTTVDAGDVQPQADGSYAEAMTVATNNSSNGVHTIVVSDGLGHSDTRTVAFSNVITNLVCGAIFDLSANSDGVPPSCHITATLALSQAWQVAVQDYNGNTVRSYSGNGLSTNIINVTWDGKDSQGNIVPDASYDVVITTSAAGSSAASPNAGGTPPVHRPAAKNSIGSSLVLVNDEPSAMIGGAASGMAYEKFLISILTPKTGIDFTTAPKPILTTGTAVDANPALRSRINSQLSIPCSLIYVYTHGEDLSKPRFNIGNWFWYSKFPLIEDYDVPNGQRFDVSSYTALAGYDNGNDPPLLAWIDTCRSAGINPLNADYSWADTFYSSQGGCFLGWTGNIGQYGAPAPNPVANIYYVFTAWRNNFWTDLFINGQNIQTSVAFANKTPGQVFKPDSNPKDIYTLYGTGSNSF